MIVHKFNLTSNGIIINSIYVEKSTDFDPHLFLDKSGGFDVEYEGEVEI